MKFSRFVLSAFSLAVVLSPVTPTFAAFPQADLTVTDIYLDTGNVLTIDLANIGDADANASEVAISVWINGHLLSTYNASTLGDQDFLLAGGSSTLWTNTLRRPGTLAVCVNNPRQAVESNYGNNCVAEALTPSF